jgi:hypothetical protein
MADFHKKISPSLLFRQEKEDDDVRIMYWFSAASSLDRSQK